MPPAGERNSRSGFVFCIHIHGIVYVTIFICLTVLHIPQQCLVGKGGDGPKASRFPDRLLLAEQCENLLRYGVGLRQNRDTCLLDDHRLGQVRGFCCIVSIENSRTGGRDVLTHVVDIRMVDSSLFSFAPSFAFSELKVSRDCLDASRAMFALPTSLTLIAFSEVAVRLIVVLVVAKPSTPDVALASVVTEPAVKPPSTRACCSGLQQPKPMTQSLNGMRRHQNRPLLSRAQR